MDPSIISPATTLTIGSYLFQETHSSFRWNIAIIHTGISNEMLRLLFGQKCTVKEGFDNCNFVFLEFSTSTGIVEIAQI